MSSMDAENLYNEIKRSIHEAAEESLGHQEQRHSRNPEWWSREIEQLVEEKKRAYEKWLGTNNVDDRRIYALCNREVKKAVIQSKNELWEKKCEEIERCMGGTRVAEAWKAIKNLRRENKESAGMSLINMEEWEKYYRTLLTEKRKDFELNNVRVEPSTVSPVEEITVEKVREALRRSKNGKAAGPGNIPIELVKYGPDILLETITGLFNRCLKGDRVPEDWNLAYISSIYKKGDKSMCKNYRGISVMSSMARLYGRVLKRRIEESIVEIEEQGGFRAGRSCTDNVFVLQQVIEKRKSRNWPEWCVCEGHMEPVCGRLERR
ncbi:uncharacterized protein LOC123319231 [Coccinella septempunctata]|uniref:uncharacterized protein LOC123319231 n=1 Tax=Coccinella septempunctata TaxID=41139 RepID=UPI001D0668D3|nr:uncharacterized protein LOC123319231 [Coccinella septempunctata]